MKTEQNNTSVTYRTRKMSIIMRIMTGNIIPKSMQLEYITFRGQDFDVKTRNGALNTFEYDQVSVTESLLGNLCTISPTIKCINTGRKVKIHVSTEDEGMTKADAKAILETLNAGHRLLT